ncbi:hypothetical protein ABCR94_27605 [Streptomyces sp. 21So2-11]|uniref:hypothetical protein n=1 Tax=Streptomyces sp. 21So2-11 TaxID=3144408 RepID=UPI003219A720
MPQEVATPDQPGRSDGTVVPSPSKRTRRTALACRAAELRQDTSERRIRHHDWVPAHGTDLPKVADWCRPY